MRTANIRKLFEDLTGENLDRYCDLKSERFRKLYHYSDIANTPMLADDLLFYAAETIKWTVAVMSCELIDFHEISDFEIYKKSIDLLFVKQQAGHSVHELSYDESEHIYQSAYEYLWDNMRYNFREQ